MAGLRKKILFIYGTRPEIIKMAPVMIGFKADPFFEVFIVHSGQHDDLTKDFEVLFNIVPDLRMNIMVPGQSLNMTISKLISELSAILKTISPDLVMVQGDTSTVLSTSICCFNMKIKYGHVEAGLRSLDMAHPFPEEFNRKVATLGATLHFCPTQRAKDNLLDEGVPLDNIFVTGNTSIDAVRLNEHQLQREDTGCKTILITCHRRENHNNGIASILKSVQLLLAIRDDITFFWPVHPNPEIKTQMDELEFESERLIISQPLNYLEMLEKIKNSFIIWTDSGGIQEEAPYFKKPVLILRKTTERPETVDAGFGIITGTDTESIFHISLRLLNDPAFYQEKTSGKNPFGDGYAAGKILSQTKNYLISLNPENAN